MNHEKKKELLEGNSADSTGAQLSKERSRHSVTTGMRPERAPTLISDERIRQILTAAAEATGLKKKLSPHWLRHAHGSHAHQRGAPAATIRDSLGHASLSTTDLYVSSSPTDESSLYLKF